MPRASAMRARSSMPTPTWPFSMRQMCDLLEPTILARRSCESPWLSLRSLIASPSARLFWSMSMPTGYVLDYPRWLHIWCHKDTAVIDLVVHGVHMTRKIVVRSKNTTFSGCGHAILSFFLGLAFLIVVIGALLALFFGWLFS